MIYVIHWKRFICKGMDIISSGIVGVFDDKKMAEVVYDALTAESEVKNKEYYLDNYEVNTVKGVQ